MAWVIMTVGPSAPLYIKTDSRLGVTARATEADRFESEYEATLKLLQLKLPRDWMTVQV